MFLAQMPLTGLADVGGSARAVMNEATSAATTYQSLRNTGDWTGLAAHVKRLAGLAAWIEADIAQRGHIASAARQQLSEADRSARSALAAIRDGEDETSEQMRANLLQLIEDGGSDDPQADLGRLLAGEGALFERAARFARLHDQLEENAVDAAVRMHVLAASGESAALVPLAAQYAERTLAERRVAVDAANDAPVPPADGDRELIEAMSAEMRRAVSDGEAALFEALENDVGRDALQSLAQNLAFDSSLRPAHAARMLGAFLVLAQQNTDPAALIHDHRLALDLAEAMQRLLLVGTYAHYITANLASRDANRWYGNEVRRLRDRTFDSQVPLGTEMTLHELSDASTGDLVRLEGFVTDLRIEDDPRPPKFSTFFALHDPASGAAVKLRAHQFSLAANGVADGVFIRLNGWVRRGETWLAVDETGVDIDRVALSELRRTSWLDDVTFRMRDYYTLYLDGMSLFHTPPLLAGEIEP